MQIQYSLLGCHIHGSEAGGLLYSDSDVDMLDYQVPKSWDLEAVVEAITTVRILLNINDIILVDTSCAGD